MLVPHVRVAALLHQGLDLGQALAETLEDSLDITTLLHGDDAEMVLLVDPDQEGLGGVGGKGDSLDGATGTDAGRENVLLVEDAALKVVGVQVGLVLGVLAISVVTAVDDGVKKISENFVGLLITGDAADGHDEGMSG